MARSVASRTVTADINVTPMIDVMLVLLIIFMIVTPAITSVPVSLPRVQNAAQQADAPGEIRLALDREARIYLDVMNPVTNEYTGPKLVNEADLPGRLAALYAGRTADKVMYLKADADLDFERVQAAIEIARRAGVRVVGTIVEPSRIARSTGIRGGA